MNKTKTIKDPDKIMSYFKAETGSLLIVTITGIIYNIGMTAGPIFEGALVQRLLDFSQGNKTQNDMIRLCILYLVVILVVQGMRCLKRFYVRRFANDTSLNMRHIIYRSLVEKSTMDVQKESVGTMMTKAVADVDACAEGMRKFTTEIFDTGVVMISYLVLLFGYDWRLTLIACCFTPFAYIAAENLKRLVYRYNSAYKKSMGKLNDITMDRVGAAVTYRVFGRESNRDEAYDKCLNEYEKKAVMANLWENSLPPIYQLISMAGVVFIIWIGSKNVVGTGWTSWNIAAFTTYISCFAKLAIKSAKAAKLFNAVQKADVSWKRIKPMMQEYANHHRSTENEEAIQIDKLSLTFENLSFGYEDEKPLFDHLNLYAKEGQIIGITGPVACGKSTLGRLLLGEEKYAGKILIGNNDYLNISDRTRSKLISYLGHQPELMSDTIHENIALGESREVEPYLEAVCLMDEVKDMPDGIETFVGNGGVRLSGGQQARLALARTLYHAGEILILDDPFSALDQNTEKCVIEHLRDISKHKIVLLISHRLRYFPQMDQIILLSKDGAQVANHDNLMKNCLEYRELYENQVNNLEVRKEHMKGNRKITDELMSKGGNEDETK